VGLRPAMVASVICALLAAACGCSGGGGSSDSLTPEQVNQFVLVREASDDLTHVLNSIRAADAEVIALEQLRPGTPRWHDGVHGEELQWSQVLTELNMFNRAQGAAVSQVETAVSQHKRIAIDWLSALEDAQKQPPASREEELKQWAPLTKAEQQARHLLKDAALGLSKKGCALGTAHRSLMSDSDLASMCAAAKALSAPPSSS
jgi:uncharacterized protein YlxW (UPF0749 family)